jgi:hypothetical protein
MFLDAENQEAKNSETAKTPLKQSIINLSALEAREYFLNPKNYFRGLPPYFNFSNLLKELSKKTNKNNFRLEKKTPRDYDDVNYKLLTNKDGEYAWRLLQLIHPAIYVLLVKDITEKKNWELIVEKLKNYESKNSIKCASLPVIPSKSKSGQREQIITWWTEVEQRSLELALDYKYLFHTDIVNCYGSIYTHAIPWALHGKDLAKEKRNDNRLLGNKIDGYLQDMSYGQTNGIPEGCALMDFIAELFLGYIDELLTKKIQDLNDSCTIIRYRDDYRIFVNNPEDGKKIIKDLTNVLAEMKMRINPEKTIESTNIIQDSIKKDKSYWIQNEQNHIDLVKHMLLLHDLALKFPHSGSLVKQIQKFFKKIKNRKIDAKKAKVLISIVVDIAYHNPKIYPTASAILSHLLNSLDSESRIEFMKKIQKKFNTLPNTEYLNLWLQRLTIKINPEIVYEGALCQLIRDTKASTKLWNNDWLQEDIKNLIENTDLIDREELEKLSRLIAAKEVDIFHYDF